MGKTIHVEIPTKKGLQVGITKTGGITLGMGTKGTSNYPALTNKPQINNVELIGNKTFEELGIQTMTNLEIKEVFDKVFNKGGN